MQVLAPHAYRAHALQLFRDHSHAAVIEVSGEDAIVEVLERDRVRPWPVKPDAGPMDSAAVEPPKGG